MEVTIWQRADTFRSQVWPSGNIPIDIMDIVEFELGLEFRAVTSLRTDDAACYAGTGNKWYTGARR
jgi:hypothetical protein